MLNYLRSVNTCLTQTRTVIYWLYTPVIVDSEKYRVFDGLLKKLANLRFLTVNVGPMTGKSRDCGYDATKEHRYRLHPRWNGSKAR